LNLDYRLRAASTAIDAGFGFELSLPFSTRVGGVRFSTQCGPLDVGAYEATL
jgi:hypothetical protein